MNRHTHIDQAFVDAQRADRLAYAPPIDFMNRPVVCYYQDAVSGEWVESIIKANDDLIVLGIAVRVVGAAEGRENFAAVMQEEWGTTLGTFSIHQVEDRAPFDQNEPGPHFPVIPVQTP